MKNNNVDTSSKESGFTLVEVMVTLVVAMVVLGGLMLNFMSQSAQYKYQDKRVDAAQDLEFAIRFIAADLESALVFDDAAELGGAGADSIGFALSTAVGEDPYSTRFLSFLTWDEDATLLPSPVNMRANRCYVYYDGMVRYSRHNTACAIGANIAEASAIIGEPLAGITGMRVSNFRIFQDDAADTDRADYPSMPPALPTKTLRDATDPNNITYDMPGFTILLEVEVDAAYKGSSVDVRGNVITNGKKRIWRFMQIYPSVVVRD